MKRLSAFLILGTMIGATLFGKFCLSTTGLAQEPAEQPVLQLIDESTKTTIFTSADIVRFDWDRQVFELTKNASNALQVPHRHFLLKDRKGIIYRGTFYSPISSIGFDGPSIQLHLESTVTPPQYRIEAWYGGRYPRSEDQRFNRRVREALKEADLLENIPRPKNTLPEAGDAFRGLTVRLQCVERYRAGEPVNFTVRERNTGDEELPLFYNHFPRFYQILITDANDKPVAKTVQTLADEDERAPRNEPVNLIRLKPGEEFVKTYDLRRYVKALPPGTYTLQVQRLSSGFQQNTLRYGDGVLSFPCRITIEK